MSNRWIDSEFKANLEKINNGYRGEFVLRAPGAVVIILLAIVGCLLTLALLN